MTIRPSCVNAEFAVIVK